MSGHERRRSDRHPIDFFVQEILEERTYLHPAINLSADGIYILVSDDRKAIDADKLMTLEFTLPTGQPIIATGVVAWVDDRGGQRGVGIQFTELEDAQRAVLDTFVTAQGGRFGEDRVSA